MTVYCANCKQVYSPRPIVDMESNVLMWNGRGVSLGRRQADVMHVLLEGPNRGCTLWEDLQRRVFGLSNIYNERKALAVCIHFLKKKISRLGITIEVIWGFAVHVHWITPPHPRMPELMENTSEESKRTEQAV